MSLMDFFSTEDRYRDEAEEILGKPDPREETDLPLHISRCAKRWLISYRSQKSTDRRIARLEKLIIFMMILLLVYVGPGHDTIWRAIFGGA